MGQNELVNEPGRTPDPAGGAPPPVINGNPLDSLMPVVLFIVVNRWVGLPWAIGAATLWSLKVAWTRRRRGLAIGKFVPIITVGIIARGLIGIITDSEAVYFGIGIGTKAAIGVGLIVSTFLGHNLIARYAPLLFGFDRATTEHPIYRRAMDRVAVAAGLGQLVSAAFDVWLFNNSSVDGYLIIRFVVNWPLTTALLLGAMFYLSRKLSEIPGFPGMNELLEERMAQYEQALKERPGRGASLEENG